MRILEIYNKYQIMPQLGEHQLRVAAVADVICENINANVDRKNIVAACLLHDMGNIIKFNLAETKSILNSDIDLELWQKVKEEYVKKYGADEHLATMEIARELQASDRVLELVDCIGFNNGPENAETKDFGKKICAYSDMRVMPKGVVGLEDRLADLRVRYGHRVTEWGSMKKRNSFESSLRKIEAQIFEHCNIKPEDITEEAIAERKEQLKSFDI